MVNKIKKKIAYRQILFFILVGSINTGATWLLYFGLSNFLHYQLAWSIAYLTGIIVAYTLNIILVFQGTSSGKKILQYPFIYVIQYFLSSFCMYILLKIILLPNWLAPGVVALLLVPVSFTMNKFILEDR